jgi:1,4-alpha-glucan branching enzyme
VRDLNLAYREEPALFTQDFTPRGFQWIDCNDMEQSVISFLRRGVDPEDLVLVVGNFTPVPRYHYRVGVPRGGFWREILNSDAREYGGSGLGNLGGMAAAPIPCHGRPHSLNLILPPLGVLFFKYEKGSPEQA